MQLLLNADLKKASWSLTELIKRRTFLKCRKYLMLRTMLELGYGDSNLGEQLPGKISPPPQAGAYQKLCICQERAVSGDLVVQQA